MHVGNSVSAWIAQLKEGDAAAAHRLWHRFVAPLVDYARERLGAQTGCVDGEDIAQSVFLTVFRGASEGRFSDVKNRDDLWWMLLAITKQKVVDHIRRETALKRGGGRVLREQLLFDGMGSLDDLIGVAPTPEFMAILDEQHERLMNLLRDDLMRAVARSRIEGLSVSEIASTLSLSHRGVERKLQLIRKTWATELSRGG